MRLLAILFCFAFVAGCENTDVLTATDAGIDAVKAITLSDKDVLAIASKAPQGSTGTPVGECVPKRSGGNPVKPGKRSLFFRKVPRACPIGVNLSGIKHNLVLCAERTVFDYFKRSSS